MPEPVWFYMRTEDTCGDPECFCVGRLFRGIYETLELAQLLSDRPARKRTWTEIIPNELWVWGEFRIQKMFTMNYDA